MNCPSRPDQIEDHPDWNQNPPVLNSDATTRADLNGIVNRRPKHNHEDSLNPIAHQNDISSLPMQKLGSDQNVIKKNEGVLVAPATLSNSVCTASQGQTNRPWYQRTASKITDVLVKYARFVGPGFLIAVAYIDPGNYSTDVSAGASTQYAHLFIILMSNLFAIFLQSLCIKLGSVTGLDLAENCRKHLPRWMVYFLYVLSEAAIIATDVAEVVGTAIALNLLLKVPLVAGCAISIVDVFLLLLFYNPDGTLTRLRIFEYFVMFLVLGVMVCFCIQLSYIRNASITGPIRSSSYL